MNTNPSKLFGVIKFGERIHMEKFRNSGQLFMNTLSYFKKLEKSDRVRADYSEGLSHTKPARGAKITFSKSNIELESVDAIRFHHPDSDNINIFSLYGINEKNMTPKRDQSLLDFGDTAVIVTDGTEFSKRVIEACENRKYRYEMNMVKYVDRDTYEGEMGPFRKYSELEYQSEYRIAIWSYKKSLLDDFFIGDVSDITELIDSKSVINNMIVTPN